MWPTRSPRSGRARCISRTLSDASRKSRFSFPSGWARSDDRRGMSRCQSIGDFRGWRQARARRRETARGLPARVALTLFGLPEQRAGRLLEDAPPGARLLALLSEALDHPAHARGRDLDAVTCADCAEVVVVLRKLDGHR